MSKITSITIDNLKRISHAEVTPGTHLFVVGGKNEQGKSTLLDAVEMAFGGKRVMPAQPIREGSESAEIIVQLDDGYRVRQRHTASGVVTTLTHTGPDGVRSEIKSPQAMLSAMAGTLALDPLAFVREAPTKQRATLQELVKLDTAALDADEREAMERRKNVVAAGKELTARIDGLTPDPDAPTERLDTAALMAELAREQDVTRQRDAALRRAADLRRKADLAMASATDATDRRMELERELELAKQAEMMASAKADEADKAALAAEQSSESMPIGQPDPIAAKIAGVSEHNARVDRAAARADLVRKRDALRDEAAQLNERIAATRTARETAIREAKWPVEGLGLSESGITYNGLPFEQASQAVRVRVSLAIVEAMSPRLRCVLMREGAFLDEDMLAVVAQWAIDRDMQVLMERVGTGPECSIVMHDGRVQS
jgi:DNA repair exonuclease SbcCD ATPase subunit